MKKLMELIRARKRAIIAATAVFAVVYPSSSVIIEAVTTAVSIVAEPTEPREEVK